MVFQRRLDYRLNGFHFPSFSFVPVSAKGKRSVRKRNVGDHICAFDLLAAVAGELFEKEISSATYDVPGSSISDSKKEIFDENKSSNNEFPIQKNKPKVSTVTCSNFIMTKDNSSWKEHSNKTLELSRTFISVFSASSNMTTGGGSSFSGKIGISMNIAGNGKPTQSLECGEYRTVIGGNYSGCYNLDDPVISDVNPLMKSDSSLEVHISRDNDPYNSSFFHPKVDLEPTVHRDDDENSSWCSNQCTRANKVSKPYLGDSLRKLLASEYWKDDKDAAKPAKLSKTAEVDLKPAFQRRKISYKHQRTQRISFKHLKLLRYSTSAFHNRFSKAGVLNILKKKILEGNSSTAFRGVSGIPSTITEHQSSYKPEDCHVKLSIKSFIVPELFIEIPETETVGSLKRTVMEAISAIIGSGLHVGVLLHGKSFRDDDRTLIQAGISHANELDKLRFTLEPNSSLPSSGYTNSEKPHFFLPCDSTKLLTRLPYGTSLDEGKSDSSSHPASLSTIIYHESDSDSVHSPLNTPSLGRRMSCQALVASSTSSVDALTVVPVHNPRTSELVKRRIRRPFAVSEVEALVEAVEKLGTGRWRDIKLQLFDDAKHRTYVDLKDKWKTLVHTARISPRQRRGEPVPQELLDRVLLAHTCWSQPPAKLSSTEPCSGL